MWLEQTTNMPQHYIAGVDEVGRGAWAGPLVTAAVIMLRPNHVEQWLPLRDSKQLSATQREKLFPQILQQAISWSVVSVPAEIIDQAGLHVVNMFALSYAITQLDTTPDLALVDGFAVNHVVPTQKIIHGDSVSYNIAAASIIAKVLRDHCLTIYDCLDERFGFAQHKGYGTGLHVERLQQHGITSWHRRSFAPIKKLVI